MVEDLRRYTPSGTEHPMDEADLAVAHKEITPGDSRLVREGVLTLEQAKHRKATRPKSGHPEDNALARGELSQGGYRQVLKGAWSMEQAKEAGRDHVDAPEAVQRAAEKSKGKKRDITVEGTEDPKGTGLVIGDEVYIRARAELVGGPNGGLLVRPVAVGEWEIDPKHIIYAYKTDFFKAEDRNAPEPEKTVEYVEYVPEKAKIKEELTAQYRSLWEMDANASANGSRDGSDSAAVQIAMNELQKLSKRLRLGIKFGELDKEAQERAE